MNRVSSRTAASALGRDRRTINDSLSIYLEDQTHPELLVNPQKKVRKISTKRADIPSYKEIQTYRGPTVRNRAVVKPTKPIVQSNSGRSASAYYKASSAKQPPRRKTRSAGKRNVSPQRREKVQGGLLNPFPRLDSHEDASPSYLHESDRSARMNPAIEKVRSAIALAQNDSNGVEIDQNFLDYQEPRRTSRSTLRTDTKTVRSNSLFHKPLPSQQPPNRSTSAYESTLSHRMYSPIAPHYQSTMDSSVSRSSSHLSHYPKSTIKTDDIKSRVSLQQNAAQALLKDYVFLVGYNPKYLNKSILADGYQEAKDIADGHLHGEELVRKKKDLLGKLVGDIAHLRGNGYSHEGGSYSIINSMLGDTYLNTSYGEHHMLPTIEEDLHLDDVNSLSKDDKGLQGDLPAMVDASVSTNTERQSCVHNDVPSLTSSKDELGRSTAIDTPLPPPQKHIWPLKPSIPNSLHTKLDNSERQDDSESQYKNQTSVTTEPEVSETLSQNPGLLVKGIAGTNDPMATDLHNILDEFLHKDAAHHARRGSRSARPPTTSSLYPQKPNQERHKRNTASARTPVRERNDFLYNIPTSSVYPPAVSSPNMPRTPNKQAIGETTLHLVENLCESPIKEDNNIDESSGISGLTDNDNYSKQSPAAVTPHQSKPSISSGYLINRINRKNSIVATPLGMVRNEGPLVSPNKCLQYCSICNAPLSPGSTSDFNTKIVCTQCYQKFISSIIYIPSGNAPFIAFQSDIEEIPAHLGCPCKHSNGKPDSVINLEACRECSCFKHAMQMPDHSVTMVKILTTLDHTIFKTRVGANKDLKYFNLEALNADNERSSTDLGSTFCQGALPTLHIGVGQEYLEHDYTALHIDVQDESTAMHDILMGMHRWGAHTEGRSGSPKLHNDKCTYLCPFLTKIRLSDWVSEKIQSHGDAQPHHSPKPYIIKSSYPDEELDVTSVKLNSNALPARAPAVHSTPTRLGCNEGTAHTNTPKKTTSVSTPITSDSSPHSKHTTRRKGVNIINAEYTYTYNIIRDASEDANRNINRAPHSKSEGVTAAPCHTQEAVQTDTNANKVPTPELVDNKDIKKRIKKYLDMLNLKTPMCRSNNPEKCLCYICLGGKNTSKNIKVRRIKSVD